MAVLSTTLLADAIRAIGLTRDEAVALLEPHGWTPAVIANMCRGHRQTSPSVLRLLAEYWRYVDRNLPLPEGMPESLRRRQETLIRLRYLAMELDDEDQENEEILATVTSENFDWDRHFGAES